LPSGILLIDKPIGITSHDVVAQLRKKLSERKIGHAGTLDPFASGLLILGVGSGTKLLHHLFGLDKQYLATIRLGQATKTDDLTGEIIQESTATGISLSDIEERIRDFTGRIEQSPSSVSAIKVEGKRAYRLALEGKHVELPPRTVEVYHMQITSELREVGQFIEFEVVVDCSSGTYIRALARDLGKAFGVGGHLRSLRRLRIGEFSITNSSTVDQVTQLNSLSSVAAKVFPSVELVKEQAQNIIHGKRVFLTQDQPVAAIYRGNLLAILEPTKEGQFRSLTVFSEAFDD
jgi:tRNA pseudouridine55 synthase